MLTIALIAAVGIGLPYSPLGGLVGIGALPAAVIAAMLAIVVTYSLTTEPFGLSAALHASRTAINGWTALFKRPN
jgi:hypothetical protein